MSGSWGTGFPCACSDILPWLLLTRDFPLLCQQPRVSTQNSFQGAVFSLNTFISLKILITFLEILVMGSMSNLFKSSSGQLCVQLQWNLFLGFCRLKDGPLFLDGPLFPDGPLFLESSAPEVSFQRVTLIKGPGPSGDCRSVINANDQQGPGMWPRLVQTKYLFPFPSYQSYFSATGKRSLGAVVLNGGDFVYQGTFSSVWRHVCLSQLGVLWASIGKNPKMLPNIWQCVGQSP